ncbi:MAG: AMP-binding protein, partial [Anaerolineae bacterium]|nr:AMP-binding protein [Anaerolineae bacterium]
MVTYADKPWLAHYDPGVPPSLEPYPQHPLQQFLIDAAHDYGDIPATLTSTHLPVVGRVKRTCTYREINAQSDALAAALVDMGLQKGDRVAVIMPNCVQFVITFYAILKAGGVVAAVNPTFPPRRMQEQLADSGTTVAITLSLFYDNLKQIQAETGIR